jgi:pantothenate kinase
MESSIQSINPSALPSEYNKRIEEDKEPAEAGKQRSRKFKRMGTDESGFEFPMLLVSIGSGVSIIKVHDFNHFERVSGTMIGGGTLIGLANLLTGNREFDKIIAKAQTGNNAHVDMLVKDIYGENSPFHLKGDLLASSFAKVAND